MAGNIVNLIRRDFSALRSERGVGDLIFVSLILAPFTAQVSSFITFIFIAFIIQTYNNSTFIIEEKYQTDKFFASLPVKRKEIVLARYYGVVVLIAFHLILSYFTMFAFKLIDMLKFQLPLGYFVLTLVAASSLTSLSLPVYFRFGATKAITGLTTGLVVIIFIILFSLSERSGLAEKIMNFSFEDFFGIYLLLTGAAVLLFVVSIKISIFIYTKRDI